MQRLSVWARARIAPVLLLLILLSTWIGPAAAREPAQTYAARQREPLLERQPCPSGPLHLVDRPAARACIRLLARRLWHGDVLQRGRKYEPGRHRAIYLAAPAESMKKKGVGAFCGTSFRKTLQLPGFPLLRGMGAIVQPIYVMITSPPSGGRNHGPTLPGWAIRSRRPVNRRD